MTVTQYPVEKARGEKVFQKDGRSPHAVEIDHRVATARCEVTQDRRLTRDCLDVLQTKPDTRFTSATVGFLGLVLRRAYV